MKNLKLFNFGKLLSRASSVEGVNKHVCETFLKENPQLKQDSPWWCEQALAAIAEHSPVKVDGKYNGPATIGSIEDQWVRGLIFYLAFAPASSYHTKKITDYPQYGSFTPMVLAAYKQYHNIGYEEWDKESCRKILPKVLAQLIGLQEIKKFSTSDLLALRAELGTKYGFGSFGKNTELEVYPVAARRMLVQNWLCDPNVYQNNGNLIVLDPFNWDRKPEPLVSIEIMETNTSYISNNDSWY